MSATDHIVLDYSVMPHVFRCNACGQTEKIDLPAPMDRVVRQANEFKARHLQCAKDAG